MRKQLFIATFFAMSFVTTNIHSGSDFEGITNTSQGTPFVELKKDQPSISGIIIDDNDKIPLHSINIAGRVTYSKMLQEENDSTSTLDFTNITKIEIIDNFYQSEKHYQRGSNQMPLIKIRVAYRSGAEEEYLIPEPLTISGISHENHIKRAWPLGKISSIIFAHQDQLALDHDDEEDETEDDHLAQTSHLGTTLMTSLHNAYTFLTQHVVDLFSTRQS